MNHARTTALGLAALAFGACSYPDFQYSSESSSSSASSSATTSGGGGMGGGSSSTSSGAGGDAGPPCMVVHPGGGTCEYLPGMECGCPANQKCSIDDLTTGHTHCITHANPMPWTKCSDDHDCGAGAWCDIWTFNVCRPICSDLGQCPPNAQCLPTSSDSSNFTAIPGLKVCTPHCDPEVPTSPCGLDVTCVYDDHDKDLQCMASGNDALNSICGNINDCAKGLVCIFGLPLTCKKWCHPANGMMDVSCPANAPNCKGLGIMINYGGSSYGICSP